MPMDCLEDWLKTTSYRKFVPFLLATTANACLSASARSASRTATACSDLKEVEEGMPGGVGGFEWPAVELEFDRDGATDCGLMADSGFMGLIGFTGLSDITGTSGITGLSDVTGLGGLTGLSDIRGTSGITGVSDVTGLGGLTGLSDVNGLAGFKGFMGGTPPRMLAWGRLIGGADEEL
jgi:hypothetical protein